MVAEPPIPRATQGRIRCSNHCHGEVDQSTNPSAGRRWESTANQITSRSASQKSGMATPRLEPTVTIRSRALPLCTPATMPAGTPMSTESNMPPTARVSVTGNRMAIPEATLWPGLNSDSPRFPWMTPLSQRRYCFQYGSLRWSWLVIFATSAGVEWMPPARARAGLPGRMRTRL